MSTIFHKIIAREIPADILYEDERALAFADIHPAAPIHFLVIPKADLTNVGAMGAEDAALVGHLLWVCRQVATARGLTDFRIVTNSGAGAGQTVFQLHFHVLGGRPLAWPPG